MRQSLTILVVSVLPVQAEKVARSGSVQTRTIEIYFLGEVNAPGLKEVKPGTTLLQAMAQTGGLTSFAADKRIQLRRTNTRTGEQSLQLFNYRLLSRGAANTRDVTLQDGDVILVPERRVFE